MSGSTEIRTTLPAWASKRYWSMSFVGLSSSLTGTLKASGTAPGPAGTMRSTTTP
jgi:hypothetical protein